MAFYRTASQNGAIRHINTSIEATSRSCLLMLLVAVFLRKSKMVEPYEGTCHLWTRSEIRFLFYMRTVRSQTGAKVTRVGSETEMKSDRSEFIFRSVPCKRMKRNVWRPIRTHTGLSSFRPGLYWFVNRLLICDFHFSLWRSTLNIDFLFCVLTFGAWPLSAAVADRWRAKRKCRERCRAKNWNCRE